MAIKLTFHGAARTVTGSSFLLECGSKRILVDCGMYQGPKTLKELNYAPFPFDAARLDAVLLTHAHLDHSGLLPKLRLAGFKGRIHTTQETAALLDCMLNDSGHIQEIEVAQLNRRNTRRGKGAVKPIYTADDVPATLKLLKAEPYGIWAGIAPGLRARWWNAGHLLGSASIEVEMSEANEKPLRLLFSGDIGPNNKLLHPDPTAPSDFDYVVCESTYGDTDRISTSRGQRRALLAEEVREAQLRGGALLIPSFAVERTQELLTDLGVLMETEKIPPAPIYVDSPLATKATAVFARFAHELEEGETLKRALRSRHLRFTESASESEALGDVSGFHIIIAGSGMCEAGRIRHHLRNWLPERRATVLMAGYQAQGTLGRILLDGATAVRIQGDAVSVHAAIRSLDIYSGHADGPELADWVRKRLPIAQAVFLVHGEEDAIQGLQARLTRIGLDAGQIVAPVMDEAFTLTHRAWSRTDAAATPRIAPEAAARLDWHNELSKLILDIGEAVDLAADERGKRAVIRRLKRALEDANGN